MKTKYGINNENKTFIHDKNIHPFLYLIINIVMSFLDFWYYLILFITRFNINKSKKKYEFSICAIFKNESLILKEWIEYHLIVGVDHFYLYNNNSDDNFKEILQPYIDKKIVTLIEWNYPPPSQFPAYKHFYDNFWGETQWVAYIDLDEFICPFREYTIKDWIEKYRNYGSVVLYWKQFGTSGKLYNDDNKLITEQYTICWNKFFSIGKTIVNTNYYVNDFSAKNLHAMSTFVRIFGVNISVPPINEFKNFIKYKSNRIGIFRNKKSFTAQINHYGTKSYHNYIYNKTQRGDVNNHVRDLETFFWSEQYNDSSDFKIFRYLTELKINMGLAENIQNLIKK